MRPGRAPLAVTFASLAVAAGAATCSIAAPAGAGSPAQSALAAFGLEICFALLALTGAALSRAPLERRLGLNAARLRTSQTALLVVGTLGLSAAIDGVLDVTQLRDHSVLADLDADLAGMRGSQLAFALLALGLAPGVAEELLCRGLIQRGLEPRLGAAPAIAISALLFGALHVDLVHATGAALLGLYLGIVCWLGASVRTAIVCHVTNNALAIATTAFAIGPPPTAAIALGSVGAGAALALVWRRAGGPPRGPGGPGDGYSEYAEEARSPGTAGWDGGSLSPKS